LFFVFNTYDIQEGFYDLFVSEGKEKRLGRQI
jgi:hypothetical protein